MDKYRLEGKTPVKCGSVTEWAEWYEKANRVVRQEMVGIVKVSTVFLGLDHSFGEGAPVLFETMIFGGKHDGHQERYYDWESAERGHAMAVAMVSQ